MIKTLIVADDLTGANATGSLLVKQGLRVGTLMGESSLNDLAQFDVLAVTTDSRGSLPAVAQQRVSQVMKQFQETAVGFFNKRIDSTMRGNIGAEIDGMLAELDAETVAIMVAAYPNSGRISSGGYLLVEGIPLEQTDVANDPISPVRDSNIVKIIEAQTKWQVGYVSLEQVMSDQATLTEALLTQKQAGKRIIVVDACTNEDIASIARAVTASKLSYIAVDPGPFTEALSLVSSTPPTKAVAKYLFVIGSATKLTRQQLAHFQGSHQPLTIKLDILRFLTPISRELEIDRVLKLIELSLAEYATFLLATNVEAADIVDLKGLATNLDMSLENVSQAITESLAEITYQVMELMGEQLKGVYLSGGDMTVAFCQRVQASGVEVMDEILPLAVYGQLIGGQKDGQVIATKGGLVGDSQSLTTCAQYLERVTQSQAVG